MFDINNNKEYYTIHHLGDITLISGYDVPIVDVVIGGSPCQDLSVAGHRAGLSGKRSGLFIEQIRIIKEMRNASRQRNHDGAGSCLWASEAAGLSSSTISKLSSNQNVNTEVLVKICYALQCDISDIAEIVITEDNL